MKIKNINENLIGIFFFVCLFTVLHFYSSNKYDEKKFRLKYKTNETIGILNDISIRGRNTSCQIEFKVLNKSYTTSGGAPNQNFEQLNDAFTILYDIDDPENNIILYHRPVVPDDLINLKGIVTNFEEDKKRYRVMLEFEYYYEGDKIERIQYFPIEKAKILEKLYKEKKDVVIGVVSDNIRRAYLNIEESLK